MPLRIAASWSPVDQECRELAQGVDVSGSFVSKPFKGSVRVKRSSRPLSGQTGPHGPIVLAQTAKARRDARFGVPLPDSPLSGRLLVALSRLYRAEDTPSRRGGQPADEA